MHPRLYLALHRAKKRGGSSSQPDLLTGEVSVESKSLPERISDCLKACDCTPEEAAQARHEYEKGVADGS